MSRRPNDSWIISHLWFLFEQRPPRWSPLEVSDFLWVTLTDEQLFTGGEVLSVNIGVGTDGGSGASNGLFANFLNWLRW